MNSVIVCSASSDSNTSRINNLSNADEHAVHDCNIRPSRRRKGLTMASLNVNSLIMKIDEIRLLIKKENFDILAINETKMDNKLKICL